VAEVAVIGIPDARWGELVCAVVVPAAGAAPTLEQLRAHCEGRLAGFKRPRRLELVRELPRTEATRQVQRALLVERIASGALSGTKP
jgi:acyl-CoA synthetase (AMP-forming)/AMP-acid ligase II